MVNTNIIYIFPFIVCIMLSIYYGLSVCFACVCVMAKPCTISDTIYQAYRGGGLSLPCQNFENFCGSSSPPLYETFIKPEKFLTMHLRKEREGRFVSIDEECYNPVV